MLSHQRTEGYGASYLLEARPAFRWADNLETELALSSWSFTGQPSTGRATLWGAGLRLDPRLSPRLRLFVDGHAGLGVTGPSKRFMFDGGGGLEYAFNDSLALGLFARYGQLADSHVDPKFAAAGAFLGLAWPGEAAPSPVLHTESPSPAQTRAGGALDGGSSGPTRSGIADADILLARDAGDSDGMMADRDAAAADGAPRPADPQK
jgi:hypothetical protein